MFTLTSLKLCLTVPRVLVQALLLIDDDVLDVLHRQVVPESMKKDVFQLLQCYPLHVKLQRQIIQELLNQTHSLQKLRDLCVECFVSFYIFELNYYFIIII